MTLFNYNLQTIITLHFEKLLYIDREQSRANKLIAWIERHHQQGLFFNYQQIIIWEELANEDYGQIPPLTEYEIKDRVSSRELLYILEEHSKQRSIEHNKRVNRLILSEDQLHPINIEFLHAQFYSVTEIFESHRDNATIPWFAKDDYTYYPLYTETHKINQVITTTELLEGYICAGLKLSYEKHQPLLGRHPTVDKYIRNLTDQDKVERRNLRRGILKKLEIYNISEYHRCIKSYQIPKFTFVLDLGKKHFTSSEASKKKLKILIQQAYKYENYIKGIQPDLAKNSKDEQKSYN
jgi:hypothetical protein